MFLTHNRKPVTIIIWRDTVDRERQRESDDAPGITVAEDYSRDIISLKPKA